MAPSFEVSTVQFSKDLRSGGKEFKRARDSLEKWHYGSELKSGVKPVYDDDLRICQAAMPKKQVRPAKKSNRCTCCFPAPGQHPNIVKPRNSWTHPPRRVLATIKVHDEMHDPDLTRSVIDEISAGTGGSPRLLRRLTGPSSANVPDVYYSYDLADSPVTKAALEDYVRPGAPASVAKATDRLVAREYEVLDLRGDVVRGHKARASLRKAKSAPVEEQMPEDDGFELV